MVCMDITSPFLYPRETRLLQNKRLWGNEKPGDGSDGSPAWLQVCTLTRCANHLEALKSFRRECWAFGLTATGDLEDLALAQHYGLATYLLDWTTNPLVALFFACATAHDEKGKVLAGEVFVLNNPERIDDDDIKGEKWRDIKGLKLYNPRLIDVRIARQRGLFTIQGKEAKTVKELVSRPEELKTRAIPANLKQKLLSTPVHNGDRQEHALSRSRWPLCQNQLGNKESDR